MFRHLGSVTPSHGSINCWRWSLVRTESISTFKTGTRKLRQRHHLIECFCRHTTGLQHWENFSFKCLFTGSPEPHLHRSSGDCWRTRIVHEASLIFISLAILASSGNNDIRWRWEWRASKQQQQQQQQQQLFTLSRRLQRSLILTQTHPDPSQEPTKHFRFHEESGIHWKSHIHQHMQHVSVLRVRW